MKGKYLLIPAVLAMCVGLTSCALMPEEMAVRTAPVVKEYAPATYNSAVVQRGELVVSEKVTCRYVPVRTDTLSFALGGEVVEKVLVQVGDLVEEGQLLAQLKLDGLEERIAQAEIDVEENKILLSMLNEEQDIRRRREAIRWEGLSSTERRTASDKLEAAFELERRTLEDALEIAQMNLDKLRDDLAQRQIRAPFGGTLTFVRDYAEGELSVFGERAMVLVDATVSLFQAETMNWALFETGDVYDITVNNKLYTITVADAHELGLDVPDRVPGRLGKVYFTLEEPDFTLSEGDFGSVELVKDYRSDTLHLPIEAVKQSGDNKLVFYMDENGLRAYKVVETGIQNNKRIEILSGLAEGDQIIID